MAVSTVASAAGDATQRLSVAQGAAAALAQAASNERSALGAMAGGATVERGVGAPAATEGGFAALADGLFAGVAAARGAESSAGGRPGEGPAGGGAWSDGSGGVSPLEPGNTDSPAAFVDPGAAGAEEQVADQVAYWVNQKTQNAELTLNRDGQPVEVSVSLSGNEAHVTFRSDQAQTRELLDQSMAQLRELLRGEGLVLSGMSVGTSALDGAGAQGGDAGQPRGRDGAQTGHHPLARGGFAARQGATDCGFISPRPPRFDGGGWVERYGGAGGRACVDQPGLGP